MLKNILFGVLVIVFVSNPVFAADELTNRILELENRVKAIQQTYLTNNEDVAKAIARSDNVQQEFVSVKGELDTNKHLIEAHSKELERMIIDLEHRLTGIEERLDIFSKQIVQVMEKVAPNVAKEGSLYQGALDEVNEGEYLKAAAKFVSFISSFPKSSFISNAQYWVGECFFSVKDYKRAIKEFDVVVQKYPRSDKAATALMRQGDSFYELDMLDQAKPFYEKVLKDYSASPEVVKVKVKLQRVEEKKNELAGKNEAVQDNKHTAYPIETIEQQRTKPDIENNIEIPVGDVKKSDLEF